MAITSDAVTITGTFHASKVFNLTAGQVIKINSAGGDDADMNYTVPASTTTEVRVMISGKESAA